MNNLSIIIPIYNEQDNVVKLAREIESAFRWVSYDWEVIWVDDCSEDKTIEKLQEFTQYHNRHKIVHLPRRGGQSSAVLNGIKLSSFDLIGTIDGDGQNSPYDLLNLKRLLEETDLILAQGVRVKRKDSKIKLFSTGIANSFRRFVLGDSFNDVGCAVRVFKKEIVLYLPAFKGWHRFLPVMISFMHPDKVQEHPVSHRERINGESKYGIMNRLWVGLFDLVGMFWLKRRMTRIFSIGAVEWKNSSMPSALPDKHFSQEGYSYNGLPANAQMTQ